MKSSEIKNEFLRELGTHKNAAKILQLLSVVPEAASSTIETETEARQTDVSKAIIWMKSKKWINSRIGEDPSSNRKKTLYSLPDHIKNKILSLSNGDKKILDLIASGHMGRMQTTATKEKIGALWKGKTRDPQLMKHIHEASRGKKRTPEQRARMSAGCKGRVISPEQRAKISATLMGRPGRKHTQESRAKLSASRSSPAAQAQLKSVQAAHCGENSHFWKGGASFYPYCPKFNKALKERVRNFFGDECVLCKRTPENNWGAALSVHHVFTEKMACCESKIEEMEAIRKRLPPEIISPGAPEFTEIEIIHIRMLVPLCKKCHGKVEAESLDIPFHETKYRKFFAELIMKHFGGKCF